jgi:hypothetical protein
MPHTQFEAVKSSSMNVARRLWNALPADVVKSENHASKHVVGKLSNRALSIATARRKGEGRGKILSMLNFVSKVIYCVSRATLKKVGRIFGWSLIARPSDLAS